MARPQEADDAVVRVFQLVRVRGRACQFEVTRRRINPELQVAHAAGHERGVGELAAAHDAIDVLADHIDHAVAHAHVELDVGIAGVEGRQRGHQDHAGQRAGHVHAKAAAGQGGGTRQAGLGVVQVGQQPHRTLVVRRAIGRDVHLARRAIEQLHTQPRLQLLHELGHAGLAHVQRVGGLGEAAGFHHAGEGLHCIETVHGRAPARRLFGICKQ
ncbi:hypothetical protein D9M68_631140 [compost metagenome]